jgi:hypothetical protein
MHPELILAASVILGVILVPSLITVRPRYVAREDSAPASTGAVSQPAE